MRVRICLRGQDSFFLDIWEPLPPTFSIPRISDTCYLLDEDILGEPNMLKSECRLEWTDIGPMYIER